MKPVRICFIQHVEFEKPALIEDWAIEKKCSYSIVHLYKNEQLPSLVDFDFLIIMGGSMGVYDDLKFPWIKTELEFINNSINAGKAILGICLGAQLIAAALGSKVYRGLHKEIGWFPVNFSLKNPIDFPAKLTVFHWHGDTFDLPEKAQLIASSEAIINQAFIYKEKVIALQFHLEIKDKSVSSMIENCSADITHGEFVQTIEKIKEGTFYIPENKKILYELLSELSNRIN